MNWYYRVARYSLKNITKGTTKIGMLCFLIGNFLVKNRSQHQIIDIQYLNRHMHRHLKLISASGSCGISVYSQKSNPGIFRDFQKPLNNGILRLSTSFIDPINLFWGLWSVQEGQKYLFKVLIFSNKFSTLTNSHWFSEARRNLSITKHLLLIDFESPCLLTDQGQIWQ